MFMSGNYVYINRSSLTGGVQCRVTNCILQRVRCHVREMCDNEDVNFTENCDLLEKMQHFHTKISILNKFINLQAFVKPQIS